MPPESSERRLASSCRQRALIHRVGRPRSGCGGAVVGRSNRLIPVPAEFRWRQGRAGIAVPCSRCLRPNSERVECGREEAPPSATDVGRWYEDRNKLHCKIHLPHAAASELPTALKCRLSIVFVIFHQVESVFVAPTAPTGV